MLKCCMFINEQISKIKMYIKNLSKKQIQSIYMIAGLLTVAIACVIALQFYNSNNSKQILQAATIYQRAIIASENHSISTADKTAKFEAIAKQHSNTSYGIFASWKLADLYVTPTKLDTKTFNINIANTPEAIQVLQQSSEANPKSNLTNITKTRLAKLYLISNQTDKAIKTLQSTADLQNNAYPLMLLGQAYLQQKNKTKAIQAWQKAEQDPNSSPEFKKIIVQLINNTI
jgi:predicted negative regulator of RcsB-dependent stress response